MHVAAFDELVGWRRKAVAGPLNSADLRRWGHSIDLALGAVAGATAVLDGQPPTRARYASEDAIAARVSQLTEDVKLYRQHMAADTARMNEQLAALRADRKASGEV